MLLFSFFRNIFTVLCVVVHQIVHFCEICFWFILFFIGEPQKDYGAWLSRIQKINIYVLDRALKIGQMQILRTLANNQLYISCRYNNKVYASAIENANKYYSLLLRPYLSYSYPNYKDLNTVLLCDTNFSKMSKKVRLR